MMLTFRIRKNNSDFFSRKNHRAIAAVVAGLIAMSSTPIVSAQTATRLSWQTFAQDSQRIASLKRAITVMKSRDAADPRSALFRTSWTYWANMHGYLGPYSTDGNLLQLANTLGTSPQFLQSIGLKEFTPADQETSIVWAQCQHNSAYFFAWHRLYLYYFEKQLQAAANDPTLRLPYWDYTNVNQRSLPIEFAQPTYYALTSQGYVLTRNPLYDLRRAAQSITLDASMVYVALYNAWTSPRNFSDFQAKIEDNLHAYVHNAVGGVGRPDMGQVPLAANDPIFYLHHANIDRQMSCFTHKWGIDKNVLPRNFFNATFSFVDTNGDLVSNPVADALGSGAILDFPAYENETNCEEELNQFSRFDMLATSIVSDKSHESTSPISASVSPTPAMTKQSVAAVANQNSILARQALNGSASNITISHQENKVSIKFDQLELNRALQESKRIRLILDGISYKKQPPVMFVVYMQSKTTPDLRTPIGFLAFFGPSPSTTMQHDHRMKMDQHTSNKLIREFDVTDSIRKLIGTSSDELIISFEATTGRAEDKNPTNINGDYPVNIEKVELRIDH